MKTGLVKGIGIILSYSWLILSIYLFDWDPSGVFLVYIAEFLMIVLCFVVADIWVNFSIEAQAKRPTQMILLFGLLVAAILYFGVGAMMSYVNDNNPFFDDPYSLITRENLIAVAWIAVVYIIQFVGLKRKHNLHDLITKNTAFQVIGLVVMIAAASLGLLITGGKGAREILVFAILGRIGYEYYLNRELHIL